MSNRMFTFNFDFHPKSHLQEMMVSPVPSSPHDLDIQKILAITRRNSDIVNHMPILRSQMHPGTLMFVFVLKQRIAYDQIKLVVQAQEM